MDYDAHYGPNPPVTMCYHLNIWTEFGTIRSKMSFQTKEDAEAFYVTNRDKILQDAGCNRSNVKEVIFHKAYVGSRFSEYNIDDFDFTEY